MLLNNSSERDVAKVMKIIKVELDEDVNPLQLLMVEINWY